MMLQLLIEQVKKEVVVLIVKETLPKIELTEGKSEEGGRMWNGMGYDRYGNIKTKCVNGKRIKQ